MKDFAVTFLELLNLLYSSVVEQADLARVDLLCSRIGSMLDAVCVLTAPEKPKWHYVLAHSSLMIQRYIINCLCMLEMHRVYSVRFIHI